MLAFIKTLAQRLTLVLYCAALDLYHSDTSMCCNSVMQGFRIGFVPPFLFSSYENKRISRPRAALSQLPSVQYV